ncbi:MAG TPA: ATP-binding protein [Polyangiaceae bacterium]|nr:ATP-binding protein [Polyangiaceae bacterium]
MLPGDDCAQDLAGALHEVSNALTVVLGWIDVAHAKLPPGPEREALEVARTHARLGYRIARQSIGAEVAEPASTQGSAQSVARVAMTGVTPQAQRAGVRLVFDCDNPDAHTRVSDVGEALQILTNLLLNAIAFTPRGRSVTLSVREDENNAVFRVVDEGPGLPPERARNVFQGPSSTRRGGAGIGLRHSKSLAEQHGGSLNVEVLPSPTLPRRPPTPPSARRSAPDLHASGIVPVSSATPPSISPPNCSEPRSGGACFELRWPIAEARSSTRPQQPVGASIKGARVLVVEDDAAVRSLIELSLDARGVETVLVQSAAELEQALGAAPYDVALLDMSPIAEHAPELLQRLRQSSPGIALILISGLASRVPEAIERDVAAWVRKPFEMGEVIDVMSRLLAERPPASCPPTRRPSTATG